MNLNLTLYFGLISSHIHGEGEYVNVQYGYELIENLKIDNALIITAGSKQQHRPKKFLKITKI